jgi:hypothetical protein
LSDGVPSSLQVYFSAFATNTDIRCHFGSSTSKSDLSSYRYSEGAPLFRRSVIQRIRFGNTLRSNGDSSNASMLSPRANDLLSSDRRSSSALSAFTHPWTYNRRLSGSPQAALPGDDLSFRKRLSSQKTLDNIPVLLGGRSPPHTSINSLWPFNDEEKSKNTPSHSPDCAVTTIELTKEDLIASGVETMQKDNQMNSNHGSTLSMPMIGMDSESSSVWSEDAVGVNSTSKSTSRSGCTCHLLWQLERDTDSIDRFKLFFKGDHRNVDWDYVQGSSEV